MDEVTHLALRARNGDRSALEAFLRAIQGDVWRYCAAMIGADQADDAAQESMLRIVRSIGRFRATSPARVWAIAVTRNTCFDLLRSRYRHRRLVDRVATERRPVGRSDHDWTDLLGLVAGLEPDRREAFFLTQVLGWSYAEAAEACDCPVGTIRSRVARARSDLVEIWAEDGNREDSRNDTFRDEA